MQKDMNSSSSSSGFDMLQSSELNSAAADPNCFFDYTDPFESALSSIVSSPVASNAPAMASQGVLLRELIGRLGSICNSVELSPESYVNNSTNTSCYSTPLNSPPKLNMRGGLPQLPSHPTLAPFSADPGFADRAARYSCFGAAELGYRSAPPPPNAQKFSPENVEMGDSREGSSVSDQIPAAQMGVKPQNEGNGRKRKSIPRGKGKESSAAPSTKIAENEESKAKKSKAKEEASEKQSDEKTTPEAPKDYIHVRARRGQATDSHSLAERVRREKISERMKFLQDLVPGCNKLTGKAVMLDEIINYVQSLQRQVEFLSMKLSTVNPRMDFNMEALVSKEILQSRGSLPQGVYPLDSSAPAFPYGYQLQQVVGISNGTTMQLPPNPMDGFGQATAPPQVSGLWEDDLQSLVQMGFIGSNQAQNFHGSMGCAEMKLEL